MPRRARLIVPGVPMHLIQRGNNRQICFASDQDYQFYLEYLKEYAEKTDCQIHAYVLMTNHVHLLVTPRQADSIGQLMKSLGQRYVQYFSRSYRRSGTLWEGRYRSCLTQEEDYLLSCQRYIELNPVRANMVEHPAGYLWSSYRINTQGEKDSLNMIKPHELYLRLGANQIKRQTVYRELLRYELEPGIVNEIRKANNGNYVLGNSRFAQEVESLLKRRVQAGKPGRPKKVEPDGTGSLF